MGTKEAREIPETEGSKVSMFDFNMYPSAMREKSEDLAQDGKWGEPEHKAFGEEFYYDTNLPYQLLMPAVFKLRAGKWRIGD